MSRFSAKFARKASARKGKRFSERRLRLEALEARQLMSVTEPFATLSGAPTDSASASPASAALVGAASNPLSVSAVESLSAQAESTFSPREGFGDVTRNWAGPDVVIQVTGLPQTILQKHPYILVDAFPLDWKYVQGTYSLTDLNQHPGTPTNAQTVGPDATTADGKNGIFRFHATEHAAAVFRLHPEYSALRYTIGVEDDTGVVWYDSDGSKQFVVYNPFYTSTTTVQRQGNPLDAAGCGQEFTTSVKGSYAVGPNATGEVWYTLVGPTGRADVPTQTLTRSVPLDQNAEAVWFCQTPLRSGTYTLTAIYRGDVRLYASSQTITFTIGKNNSAIPQWDGYKNLTTNTEGGTIYVGNRVLLRASVQPYLTGSAQQWLEGGRVEFYETVGGVERRIGIGTIDAVGYAVVQPDQLPAGSNNISLRYIRGGNPDFADNVHQDVCNLIVYAGATAPGPGSGSSEPSSPTTRAVTFQDNVAPAGTGLNTRNAADSGTLAANAAPSIVPTGTVTFKDGNTVLAVVPVDAKGVASYTTSTLSLGTHQITMVYSGDKNYLGHPTSFTQTIVSSQVDLIPARASVWNDKIPVGITKLTAGANHNYTGTYYSNQTLYVNWAVLNRGYAATSGYNVRLTVSGPVTKTFNWSNVGTTKPGGGYYPASDQSLGTLPPGVYTLTLAVDSANAGKEFNESNNVYTRTITVVGPPQADQTPGKPSVWNDKLPVGITQLNAVAAHNYTGAYYSNQTLYVNWAALNQGTAPASGYKVRLAISGPVNKNYEWVWPASIATNPGILSVMPQDQAIGALPAGKYTFTLTIDSGKAVQESDESNNVYTRPITVLAAPRTAAATVAATAATTKAANTLIPAATATTNSSTSTDPRAVDQVMAASQTASQAGTSTASTTPKSAEPAAASLRTKNLGFFGTRVDEELIANVASGIRRSAAA